MHFTSKQSFIVSFPNSPTNGRNTPMMNLLLSFNQTRHQSQHCCREVGMLLAPSIFANTPPNHLCHMASKEQIINIFILRTKITFWIPFSVSFNKLSFVSIASLATSHMKILIFGGTLPSLWLAPDSFLHIAVYKYFTENFLFLPRSHSTWSSWSEIWKAIVSCMIFFPNIHVTPQEATFWKMVGLFYFWHQP